MPALHAQTPSTLQYDILTTTVRNIKLPEMFPSESYKFLCPETRVDGKVVTWDTIVENRTAQEYVGDYAPAKPLAFTSAQHNTATLPLMFLSFSMALEDVNQLRKLGTLNQEQGLDKLAENLQRAMYKIKLSREAMIWKLLSDTYTIKFDGVTNTFTDYKASGNRPTANASWATTTTDILGDIATWKLLLTNGPGLQPTHAFLNSSTKAYVTKNDNITNLIQSTSMADDIVTSPFEQFALGGLQFVVIDGIYTDAVSGSSANFVANQKLVICSSDTTWSQMFVGNVPVVDKSGNPKFVFGPASYSETLLNPISTTIYVADRHLAVSKIADASVYADVVP